MLKRFLAMFVVMTAIFVPAELRANEYNPYADSLPLPQTEKKQSAPKQTEQKKESTAKNKLAPKKNTPKKRVAKPTKNENKIVKAKTNAPARNYSKIVEHSMPEEKRTSEELMNMIFHNFSFFITDWNFSNMTAKLYELHNNKAVYNIKLEGNPFDGIKLRLADKPQKFLSGKTACIIPSGWEWKTTGHILFWDGVYRYKNGNLWILNCHTGYFSFPHGDTEKVINGVKYHVYQSGMLIDFPYPEDFTQYRQFSLTKASQ